MTISGRNCSKRATSSSTLSASTCAVCILGLPMAFTTASHFDFVRLAIMMSVNTSGFCATLCATTVPTPPAPIINTLPISSFLLCCSLYYIYVYAISVGEDSVNRGNNKINSSIFSFSFRNIHYLCCVNGLRVVRCNISN